MPGKDNYTSVSKYAASKKVGRERINYLIEKGVIIPHIVGGTRFIDLDVYGDLDVKEKPVKEKDITSLIGYVKELRQEVNKMKKIVYNNDFGASKG